MSKVDEIINNMEKIMVGKRKVIERIVIALLTNGHVLIEDVPGEDTMRWCFSKICIRNF